MKISTDYPQLQNIETEFLKKMSNQLLRFSKGETENPKWLQYREIKNDVMYIVSSQNNRVGFSIYLFDFMTDEEIHELQFAPYNEIYIFLKELKYNFLEKYGIQRI